MRKPAILILFCLFFFNCKTFDIQRDAYDGSRIIEYSFISSDAGGADALFSLDWKFQKTIRKTGEPQLRLFFHAIGNAYMALNIEPKITLRTNAGESILPIANLSYTGERTGGADHKGYIETGIPSLHIRGELDLTALKDSLLKTDSLVLRIQREGKSAVFVCSAKEISNIGKLIQHTGEE
jgi:hypothetical protein